MHITNAIQVIKQELADFETHYSALNKTAPTVYPLEVDDDKINDWFMLFIDFHVNGSIL
jgi:hypothetical protein